jgi:hypothetical protein
VQESEEPSRMSRNINGVPVIEDEPDFICALCGKIAETRPYGPNGEEICFDCGIKNEPNTTIQMNIRLFGMSEEEAKRNI